MPEWFPLNRKNYVVNKQLTGINDLTGEVFLATFLIYLSGSPTVVA